MTTGIRLSRVVDRLEEHGLVVSAPDADPALRGIHDDSRDLGPGDLFCAWSGVQVDAHRYLPEAERRGAVAALVECRVDGHGLPQVVVQDGRRAAAVAADLVFGEPSRSLTLVGVTGTNGKTTTTWLLRHLLEPVGPAASLGTLGITLGGGRVMPDEPITTPGPVGVSRILRGLVDRGIGAVAMEVSSHALHQGRVHALWFDAAVYTNLTRDHLDYHGDVQAYLEAKRILVDLLRPDGVAVVNADDPAWSGMTDRAPRCVRFGLDPTADVRAEAVDVGPHGARFRLVERGVETPVELPLLGDFNVQNALGAAAVALELGVPRAEVAERLRTAPQVPGRLERIATEPCPVLRDYAHTADALDRVLETLRSLVPGRLITVFGAGGDRDPGKRPLMGAAVAKGADLPIVTSDNPRTEDPDAIIDDIIAGMDDRPHIREVDRRRAIERAVDLAGPDDLVLLAGKGHETYQVLGTERVPFDEGEIVRALEARDGRKAGR